MLAKFKRLRLQTPYYWLIGLFSILQTTAIVAKKLLSGPLIHSSSRDRMIENGNKKARFFIHSQQTTNAQCI
jgi:hypothetical protein